MQKIERVIAISERRKFSERIKGIDIVKVVRDNGDEGRVSRDPFEVYVKGLREIYSIARQVVGNPESVFLGLLQPELAIKLDENWSSEYEPPPEDNFRIQLNTWAMKSPNLVDSTEQVIEVLGRAFGQKIVLDDHSRKELKKHRHTMHGVFGISLNDDWKLGVNIEDPGMGWRKLNYYLEPVPKEEYRERVIKQNLLEVGDQLRHENVERKLSELGEHNFRFENQILFQFREYDVGNFGQLVVLLEKSGWELASENELDLVDRIDHHDVYMVFTTDEEKKLYLKLGRLNYSRYPEELEIRVGLEVSKAQAEEFRQSFEERFVALAATVIEEKLTSWKSGEINLSPTSLAESVMYRMFHQLESRHWREEKGWMSMKMVEILEEVLDERGGYETEVKLLRLLMQADAEAKKKGIVSGWRPEEVRYTPSKGNR